MKVLYLEMMDIGAIYKCILPTSIGMKVVIKCFRDVERNKSKKTFLVEASIIMKFITKTWCN
jgi:hypothetical protein